MEIKFILAERERIVIKLSAPCVGSYILRRTEPVIIKDSHGVRPGSEISTHQLEVTAKAVEGRCRELDGDCEHGESCADCPCMVSAKCELAVPRFTGDLDGLFYEYNLYAAGGERVLGVKYVTDIADDLPENRLPYPQPQSIKALSGAPEDLRELGVHQTLMNVNLPALMSACGGAGTLEYQCNGRTYYFIETVVRGIDETMLRAKEQDITVTMILLNSPRLFGSKQEALLLQKAIHPHYDWDSPDAYISAFDMETAEGQGYFRAFTEFLAARYAREDQRYGRAVGFIVSNEVDSQYVWGNAGEMSCVDYVREYAQALRTAWQSARKHSASFRVYVSLDHYFHGLCHNIAQPLRYYQGREVLDRLNEFTKCDGDFDWGVAYHPYPEDLRWPDFWHDRSPDFTFSTPRITFKNIEMLPAYLSQPCMLYQGVPRRIILSEQGFNSHSGELAGMTERMGAAGYCFAYVKARALPTIDLMTHHAYVDNPHEFGLNLGIRRYDQSAIYNAGVRKPIYESIRAMDTPAESTAIAQARTVIGEELFDYLLNPPITHADRNTTQDQDFS